MTTKLESCPRWNSLLFRLLFSYTSSCCSFVIKLIFPCPWAWDNLLLCCLVDLVILYRIAEALVSPKWKSDNAPASYSHSSQHKASLVGTCKEEQLSEVVRFWELLFLMTEGERAQNSQSRCILVKLSIPAAEDGHFCQSWNSQGPRHRIVP